MIRILSTKKSTYEKLIPLQGEGINIKDEPVWGLTIDDANMAHFSHYVEKDGEEITTFCHGNGDPMEPREFKENESTGRIVASTVHWKVGLEAADLVKLCYGIQGLSGDEVSSLINTFYTNLKKEAQDDPALP